MSSFLKFCVGIINHSKINSTNIERQLKIHSKLNKYLCSFKTFNFLTTRTFCSRQPSNSQERDNKNTLRYEQIIDKRRKQASQSLLIQVHSESSCGELYDYCNNIAPVLCMMHYCLPQNRHFVLVEFASSEDVNKVHSKATHFEKVGGFGGDIVGGRVPVLSPLLWFRATSNLDLSSSSKHHYPTSIPNTVFVNTNQAVTLNQIPVDEWLEQALSPSDEVLVLYNATRLDDLGIRLRFLVAQQIELSLKGIFPNCRAMPFGSSVNGLGRIGCDLDLYLEYDSNQVDQLARLVYQSKGSSGRNQRQMETLADIISLFLPGCSNVKRILRAKVPIVKFDHEMTATQCDLSISNMSGVYMSELIWLWGEVEPRFRPMVFFLKRWLESSSLTHPSKAPGPWMTNFSLVLLVAFYLQSLKILPTLDRLISTARATDVRWADEINCTFNRDPSQIDGAADGGLTSLSDLLRGFFQFYSTFDFGTSGISVILGKSVVKPDASPLYIVNPLERGLNVARNVSPREVDRFRAEARNALWTIDSFTSSDTNHDIPSFRELIPSSLSTSESQKNSEEGSQNSFSKQQRFHRIVAVKDLFRDRGL